METVRIKDKEFRVSIPAEKIQERVKAVAEQINRDMEGKNPLLIAVEISFVKLASYQGTTTTGTVKEVFGINEDLQGRTIIIVEDIVDTGLTIKRMVETLGTRNPESIHVCTLLVKPGNVREDINVEYVAFEIPNDFILGYGLDYDQQGRNLPEIYTIVKD